MKNRWLIAACSVGIHVCIGSVYAWSVLNKPLLSHFGLKDSQLGDVTLTFGIAIFFLGMSAAFLGRFVERHGPRRSGMLAAVLFGTGMIGAGLAVRFESLPLLYLFYGVVGGMGLGTGYITPVSTLIKWFPDKRGLATGMAIMGFGFASFIAAFIMPKLIAIESIGLEGMFYIMGAAYAAVMFASASYLAPPPEGYTPPGFDPKSLKPHHRKFQPIAHMTANESLRTSRFYMLWVMLFINITCGIALLSVAKDIGQQMMGMTAEAAAGMVGMIAIFNGLGRIGWSSLSDYIGRPLLWIIFFIIQIAAYVAIPSLESVMLFQIVMYIIITCYGGGFASVPAYISDIFGTRQVSAIHGYILTAWAMAGLVGSKSIAFIYKSTGRFDLALYIFAGLFCVVLVISIILARQVTTMRVALHAAPEETTDEEDEALAVAEAE